MNDFDTRLDALINRLRSGEATGEEIAEIEHHLADDAELRKRYRSRMRMEAHLFGTFQEHQPEMVPFESVVIEKPKWSFARHPAITIAAGVMLTALLISVFVRPNSPKPVAMIESISGAAWEGTLNITDRSELPPGVLRLKAGMANIRFNSGALVVLEAPAEFKIESAMRSRLISGKALVEAPESAHGFVMATPHGFVTDHGTRFSVSVDEAGAEAKCEVLEGEISLHHDGTGKVQHLLDQQASVMNSNGIRELDLLPSTFVQQPGSKSILLGTSGKETSVVRNDSRDKLLHPSMLMVKKSFPGSSIGADRRALFSIGLSGIDVSNIKAVNLRLNIVPSGLGFAAYLPETVRFAVYGIIDEARENWTTEDLHWADAPGHLATARDQLNAEEAKLLGTFEISRGQQRGSIVFKSEELIEFVRSDTTSVASFIIVRQTAGENNSSLVNAFASNQHPEASGPTLELFPEE
ncbi:MAG: FecR domain-containing protein [Verrucomicrobiales bacterium]